MLFIYITLNVVLFMLGLISFYDIYNDIKEDYETYKRIYIYPWQIFTFIIGVALIIISYKMLLLIL
jgi:hypothetical protein